MAVLLNWLWLGAVVALGSRALIGVLTPLGPRPRYRIWSVALVVALVLPLLPSLVGAIMMWSSPDPHSDVTPVFVVSVPHASWMSSTLVLVAWTMWVVFFAGRLAWSASLLYRARRAALPFPEDIEGALPHWQRIGHTGRQARLAVSDRVTSAAVLGFRTPVIAISPLLLERLNTADLDRVIVHEWAHVQRRDDVAQIAQLVVRAIAGWHPALWWIDRQVHLERELACDEEALRVTGSSRAYATCLLNVAEIVPSRLTTLPAPGAVGTSHLRTRVVRLLALGAISSSRRSLAAVRFMPALLVLLTAAMAALTGVEIAAAGGNLWPPLPLSFSVDGEAIWKPVPVANVAPEAAVRQDDPSRTKPAAQVPARADGPVTQASTPAPTVEATSATNTDTLGARTAGLLPATPLTVGLVIGQEAGAVAPANEEAASRRRRARRA